MQRSRGSCLVLGLVFLLIAVANFVFFTRNRNISAVSPPAATVQTEQPTASPTTEGAVTASPVATVLGTPKEPGPTEAPTTATASPPDEARATPLPETTASPTAGVAGSESEIASIESLDQVMLERRDAAELALAFGRTPELKRAVSATPLDAEIGSKATFFVSDITADQYYTTTATLHFALDRVLMYVEDGIEFDQRALEQSARDFNDRIYPRNRELFGEEPSPGVDGDPRITILNARISGAGGYFSGSDAVPREVNRYSNEREMFYMNVEALPLGSDSYSSVLAHEFQHMIQWPQATLAATWFNEGLSQLAEELNGFADSARSTAPSYLAMPDLQLTDWAEEPSAAIGHYGAAYLFLSYFYQQYGHAADLQQLIREGAGERLDLLAADAREVRSDIDTFDELFADWTVANLLNVPRLDGGRWSYRALPGTVQPELTVDSALRGDVAQYGADYLDLGQAIGDRVFHFDGSDQIGVAAANPDGVAWWSNRGDDAVSYLTRRFDLSGPQSATLQFRLWYDIEEGYDYGFVSASADDGKTWTTLQGRHTTTEDPQGANYGHGYTGTSGGETATWVDEAIDLSAYAGQQVVLRFAVITDDAFNRPGMIVDDLRIPEIGFADDVEQASGGWDTAGWVRTDNQLQQRWQLRLVHAGGGQIQVQPVAVDEQGRAEVTLKDDERGVLIVSATTPHTSERASYTITPEAPSVSGGSFPQTH